MSILKLHILHLENIPPVKPFEISNYVSMNRIKNEDVVSYFRSYEKLFHNTKDRVSYYRRLSGIVNWIVAQWSVFLLPFIPTMLYFFRKYEEIEFVPLINVADSYFFMVVGTNFDIKYNSRIDCGRKLATI